jgi:predicted enzyme related to lactoylglutathione lyase
MDQVVHFEIHADDPHRAIEFYSGAFGWTIEQMGSEDYWLVTTTPQGGVGINGAIIKRRGQRPEIGAPIVGAVVTVQVEDVDTALTRSLKHGGHLALEKMTIPNVGSVAYVHDTEANVLGIFQPVLT